MKYKSFLVLFFKKEQVFFFEKKKQKTFVLSLSDNVFGSTR
jgi:hypothetical protein